MAKASSAGKRKTAVRKVTARKVTARKVTESKAAKPARRPQTSKAGGTERGTRPASKRIAGRRSAPHKFVVSHLTEASFAEGLRAYAKYRDLGIAAATGGMVRAHVIRFVPPCRPEEVSKPHRHEVDFQMIYVLKGWMRSDFAGEGAHTFHAGACWIQPSAIEHRVLDYSDDCEVLEIVLPADFETVELE